MFFKQSRRFPDFLNECISFVPEAPEIQLSPSRGGWSFGQTQGYLDLILKFPAKFHRTEKSSIEATSCKATTTTSTTTTTTTENKRKTNKYK